MEYINKVTIQGTIGGVKFRQVGGKSYLTFSVATNYAYKDNDGCVIVETTWHRVTSFMDVTDPQASLVRRGTNVLVEGRLVEQRYIDSNGIEQTALSIHAKQIAFIPDKERLTLEISK